MKEVAPTKVAFKMMDNVQNFLVACKAFGVSKLFRPNELVKGEDFLQVLHCIQELASLVSYFVFVRQL
jgi:hypothetical protein